MADPAATSSGKIAELETARLEREQRKSLISAVGIALSGLPQHTRAAVEALAGEILALREERAALMDQLREAELLADRDALCPVFNRRAFERELRREIALSERYGTPLCLIYIDLDRFKLVNDRFGHATGDSVIRHVAETLLQNVRQTDIIGRLGGDEFAIAMTHAEHADCLVKAGNLEALISSIRVRDPETETAEPVHLGASCGTVQWSPGQSAEFLIAQADETMFRAKNEKRRASIP